MLAAIVAVGWSGCLAICFAVVFLDDSGMGMPWYEWPVWMAVSTLAFAAGAAIIIWLACSARLRQRSYLLAALLLWASLLGPCVFFIIGFEIIPLFFGIIWLFAGVLPAWLIVHDWRRRIDGHCGWAIALACCGLAGVLSCWATYALRLLIDRAIGEAIAEHDIFY